MKNSNSILFTEASIRGLKIKNRFVRSATYEGMGTRDGRPTKQLLNLYWQLAAGEVGLIITGGTLITRPKTRLPNVNGGFPVFIDDDGLIEEWFHITKKVRSLGSKIVMQIAHPGSRANPAIRGEIPIAPSDLFDCNQNLIARSMTEIEIQEAVENFSQTCRRVKKAGFDGVQLHGGHGLLISNFLSPSTNHRTDQYGGSTRNRTRFLLKIIKRTRELVGYDYPFLIKMNCDDFVSDGLTIKEAGEIAKAIVEVGIDCIEVTGGVPASRPLINYLDSKLRDNVKEEAYFKALSLYIKGVVDIPVILVGGIRTPRVMERIIEENAADFIALSRPLIREPYLPKRIKSNNRSSALCVSCNQCLKHLFEVPLRCYNE